MRQRKRPARTVSDNQEMYRGPWLKEDKGSKPGRQEARKGGLEESTE